MPLSGGVARYSHWDACHLMKPGRPVTVPLEKAGISFSPFVLDEIVEHTHCYPFFLQIWGDCLARSLDQTGQTEVTPEMLREVEKEVINERDLMYQTRFDEIEEMELLSVAESVADAFIQNGQIQTHLHGSVLKEAIKKGMAEDRPDTTGRVMENLKQLSHLGYVWKVGGANYETRHPQPDVIHTKVFSWLKKRLYFSSEIRRKPPVQAQAGHGYL